MVNITVMLLDRAVAAAGIPTRLLESDAVLAGSAARARTRGDLESLRDLESLGGLESLRGLERTRSHAPASQPLTIPAPDPLVPVG